MSLSRKCVKNKRLSNLWLTSCFYLLAKTVQMQAEMYRTQSGPFAQGCSRMSRFCDLAGAFQVDVRGDAWETGRCISLLLFHIALALRLTRIPPWGEHWQPKLFRRR